MAKNIASDEKQAEVGKVMEMAYRKKKEMFFRTVSITLGTILAFGSVGWIIDTLTNKEPIFLLVFIALSFPVTQVILYNKVKRVAKK